MYHMLRGYYPYLNGKPNTKWLCTLYHKTQNITSGKKYLKEEIKREKNIRKIIWCKLISDDGLKVIDLPIKEV